MRNSILIIVGVSIVSMQISCMSMQTRKSIVEEQVQMHPEFTDMMETMRRIETKCDDSLNRLAGMADIQVEATDRITEAIKKLQAELDRRNK